MPHSNVPKNANSLPDEEVDEQITSHPSTPTDEESPELIAHFNDKEYYELHIRNLNEYKEMR